MRLFIALDLPEAVRASLMEFSATLRQSIRGPRWVRMEGLHITLKFIGEVAAERLEKIQDALAEIRGLAPVELRFAGLGFFPYEKRPRIFWAGIQAGPALANLAAAIETKLEPLGIPRETRDFHPHITIARIHSMEGVAALRAAVAETAEKEFGRSTPEEFYLYRSVLKSSGAEYTRLAAYHFTGGRST